MHRNSLVGTGLICAGEGKRRMPQAQENFNEIGLYRFWIVRQKLLIQ